MSANPMNAKRLAEGMQGPGPARGDRDVLTIEHKHHPISVLVTAESKKAAAETATLALEAMKINGHVFHYHFAQPPEQRDVTLGDRFPIDPLQLPVVHSLTDRLGQEVAASALESTRDGQMRAFTELVGYFNNTSPRDYSTLAEDLFENRRDLLEVLGSRSNPAHQLYGPEGEPVTTLAKYREISRVVEKTWVAVALVQFTTPISPLEKSALSRIAIGRSFVALRGAAMDLVEEVRNAIGTGEGTLDEYSRRRVEEVRGAIPPQVMGRFQTEAAERGRYEQFLYLNGCVDALLMLVNNLQKDPVVQMQLTENVKNPPKPKESGVPLYG